MELVFLVCAGVGLFMAGYLCAAAVGKRKIADLQDAYRRVQKDLEVEHDIACAYMRSLTLAREAYAKCSQELSMANMRRDYYLQQCRRIALHFNLYQPNKPRFAGRVDKG